VEVSDSTIEADQEDKIPACGSSGVGEVWIVNLNKLTVEIYREPNFTGYGAKTILRAGDQAGPQAFPDAVVDVAELLKR
jgi:Uma2 family endonuclease